MRTKPTRRKTDFINLAAIAVWAAFWAGANSVFTTRTILAVTH